MRPTVFKSDFFSFEQHCTVEEQRRGVLLSYPLQISSLVHNTGKRLAPNSRRSARWPKTSVANISDATRRLWSTRRRKAKCVSFRNISTAASTTWYADLLRNLEFQKQQFCWQVFSLIRIRINENFYVWVFSFTDTLFYLVKLLAIRIFDLNL